MDLRPGYLLGALALVAACGLAACTKDDDRPTLASVRATLSLELDRESCEAQGTTLAIDEIDGVDITYHFQSITLTPGRSYSIRLRAPATYRVRFIGYDAAGQRTSRWDFETTLEIDVPKTEVLRCPSPSPWPGEDVSARVGSPTG